MASDYSGVDNFSSTLSLMTDGDQPRAQTFRLPLERLLDNDIHLHARIDAAESRIDDNYAEIFEDFHAVVDNSGAGTPHLLADSVWMAATTNNPTISQGLADHANGGAGALRVSTAGGSAVEAGFRKGSTFTYGSIVKVTARVCLRSIASGMGCEVGLGSDVTAQDPTPGDASGTVVSAIFLGGVASTWRLRTRTTIGPDEAFVDTGVAAAAGEYVKLELERNGDGNWTLAIDGAVVATASDAQPAASFTCQPFLRASAPASGSSRAVDFDLFRLRSAVAR